MGYRSILSTLSYRQYFALFFSVITFSAHFSQQDVVKIVISLSQATFVISLLAAFRCFLAQFFLKLPQDEAQQNSPHP